MSRDKRKAWASRRRKRQQEQEGGGEARRCFMNAEALEKHGITAYQVGKKKSFLAVIAHDDDDVSYELNIHYGVGVDDKQYMCPRDVGESCPICEKFVEIKGAHQKEGRARDDEDAWEELKPFYVNRKKPHHLLLVRDLKALDKGEDAPLQYVILPESVAGPTGDLAELCFDPTTDEVTCIPTDPVDGRDFFFETVDQGGFTNYKRCRLLDRKDDKGAINYLEEYPEWYKDIPRHADLVQVTDYDEMASEVSGVSKRKKEEEPDDGEPDKEEQPSRRRRRAEPDEDDDTPKSRLHDDEDGEDDKPKDDEEKPKRGRRSRTEPEDDDEPEAEEKPKRGRRSNKTEDDDDDEPEEKPKRSRRRRSE